MGARKLDDEGLDGRALAALADVLRVRRGSTVAADIIGDAEVKPGETATVRVAGTTEAPERKPRRKLKLVGKNGQVTREVDDVALVGALAVRAEIETAKVTGGKPFILCSEPGCRKPRVVRPSHAGRVTRCERCQREYRRERDREQAADPKVRERERERGRERGRERRADPEFRKRKREQDRKRMADPKVRERKRKRHRKYLADPKVRERDRERMRAYRARKKAEREAAKRGAS